MSNPTNPGKTARLAKSAKEVATHCADLRTRGFAGLAKAIEVANTPLSGPVNTYGGIV